MQDRNISTGHSMSWRICFFWIIFCSLFCSSYTFAAGEKDRMWDRLPLINQLKAEGVIGESNKGYLVFIGNKHLKANVIEAENNDRRSIYTTIGKKNRINLETMEKRRVLQIREKAKSGTWLQRDDGSWYQK